MGCAPARTAEAVGLLGVLRRLDWLLLAALAATAGFGLWAIDGITMHDAGGSAMARQALYVFAGGVLFVAALFVDPDTYRRLRKPIYFGTLSLMVFVLATGAATRGSKRWVDVGFFKFQPSEFGKVLFVLALAGLLADRSRSINSARATLSALGYGLAPILLVFLQPDIGTALVYASALGAVLFIAGVRWWHLGALAAATVVAALAILWVLRGGRERPQAVPGSRLTGFTIPATIRVARRTTSGSRSSPSVRAASAAAASRRDPNPPQLPAGARDRLRVRVARRAARVLRRVDPAAALPADRLARA